MRKTTIRIKSSVRRCDNHLVATTRVSHGGRTHTTTRRVRLK